MSEFYAFAGEHYVLTFFLAWIAGEAIIYPFKALFRHLNIRSKGWPPPHCDSDGNEVERD